MTPPRERARGFARETGLLLAAFALVGSLGFVVPLWIAHSWAREAASQVAAGTRYQNSFPFEEAAARLRGIGVAWAMISGVVWIAAGGLWWRNRIRAGRRGCATAGSPGRPGERQVRRLVFLGEQDGPVERQLKDRLISAVLSGSPIVRAYLARVEADNESGVALCLRSDADADSNIVRKVAGTFAEMFGAHEHLDVLFLDDTQELELRSVCTPFWGDDA